MNDPELSQATPADILRAAIGGRLTLATGDCRLLMAEMEPSTVDSIVCDPPYEYGFMGAAWDRSGVAFQPETWTAALRVAKPGTHLVAFGGPRTSHRLTTAIEDAGWEIRDSLMWMYGTGMPKSLNVGREIDRRGGVSIAWFGPWLRSERERRGLTQKALAVHFPSATGGMTGCVSNWELGTNLPTPDQFNLLRRVLDLPFDSLEAAERAVVEIRMDSGNRRVGVVGAASAREFDVTAAATDEAKRWDGWGTALKPAWEPIILARAPLSSTVAETVMVHGTGALNIMGCRIDGVAWPLRVPLGSDTAGKNTYGSGGPGGGSYAAGSTDLGRWPANVILSHSPDCDTHWAGGECAPDCPVAMLDAQAPGYDTAGASRFMYVAKSSRSERDAGLPPGMVNDHPTVKPIEVMRWLARLVTPPGGLVFDPFMGSGTTGCATELEGFRFLGIDLKARHEEIARHRIMYWRRMAAKVRAEGDERKRVQSIDLFDCL